MTRSALALVTEPVRDVRVIDSDRLTMAEIIAGSPTRFSLHFDRWYRKKSGGGYWQQLPVSRSGVDLEAPRLADWTRETVEAVITIARAELAARGARGRLQIVATPNDSYIVSAVDLEVRVGHHRATLWLNAGTVRYPLPAPILFTVADRVSRPTKKLTDAVQRRRELTDAVQHVGRRSGDA